VPTVGRLDRADLDLRAIGERHMGWGCHVRPFLDRFDARPVARRGRATGLRRLQLAAAPLVRSACRAPAAGV
jgi:hypothetical protein